jgi:Tol biopolymer transport system component
MDGLMDKLGGKSGEWGIVVCDARGGEGRFQILHRFDNSRGARSWRRNDPHPVFSADGRRVYFNVSEGEWTQLYVAERADGSATP